MKLYDFRIIIRKAEFSNGFVSVPYGASEYVYFERCSQMTFADAQNALREASANESRPHVGYLTMKYRDDRKPPGYNDRSKTEIQFAGVTHA